MWFGKGQVHYYAKNVNGSIAVAVAAVAAVVVWKFSVGVLFFAIALSPILTSQYCLGQRERSGPSAAGEGSWHCFATAAAAAAIHFSCSLS